ncbi:Male sterility [Macleaya cordata]|uniref:Fatty acyl-CoA reductase n=1 Tax=Macleaya cordata TaxID=56857 RepID=A0A200PSN5_MACCD|nr:Male sterility [Macleaya cordata]
MEFNGAIVESLEQKSILVTGATGFLAKVFVEKLLRVQPNLNQLFLLVRASDSTSATQRFHNEVIGKEVFRVLRTKYGVDNEFDSFISAKITLVPGDIILGNLGIKDTNLIEKMWKEVDVVANFAATTKFDESRYDVAFGINTIGDKHVLDFAKKCVKLKMLLHISTAYVWGEKRGVILLENPLKMGDETLNETSVGLDSEVEVKLLAQRLDELKAEQVSLKEETDAMKEFGLQRARLFGWPNPYVFTKAMGEMVIGELKGDVPVVIIRPTIVTSTYKEPFLGWIEGVRTIDSVILGVGKGRIKCGLAKSDSIMDVIPGDMVVNAAIVAMMAHANQPSEFMIYQVGSSARAPLSSIRLRDFVYDYFSKNPLLDKNGKPIKIPYPIIFPNMATFLIYIHISYRLPLKVS